MERKAVSGIMLALMLIGTLTLAFKALPVKANGGEITVTGTFTVKHPTWASPKPIRYAYVELRDRDVYKPYDVLASGVTSGDGSFSFGPLSNIDDEEGTQDIYLEIWADTNDATGARVDDEFGSFWWNNTKTIYNVPDGTYDFGTIEVDEPENAAFNIFNVLINGYRYVQNSPPFQAPPKVTALWYPENSHGTHYHRETREIHILGTASDPDQWDDGVILHEYGHHLACAYDFDNGGGFHRWWLLHSREIAWSEGWAHYFSSVVRQSPSWRDTKSDTDGDGIGEEWEEKNVENGVITWSNGTKWNANNLGFRSEAAVAGILWDIYDNVDDDQNGDGIGDNLTTGDNLIWDVVRNYTSGGHGVYTIFEFSVGWVARGHDLDLLMAHVFWEHMPPLPEDINCDGIVDIFDVVGLAVAYGTMPGDPNWNFLYDLIADGIIDIFDLVKLCVKFGITFP